MEAAVTEGTEAASSRISICPRIVSLNSPGKYQIVPVRLYNMSAKILTIKPSSALCELQEVKVLRNPDIGTTKSDTAQSQQHVVGNKTRDKPVQVPDGINLDDCCINDQQKEQLGNGMVERFNKTLFNMMATLQEVKKTDWKAHVSTLTHAYNAAVHDSTGFAPYYLMFGRHPRLAIDAFLGLPSNNPIAKSKQDYNDKLKEQLHTAYDKASKEAKHAGAKYKKYYDKKIRYAVLQPGDRVLIQNVGLQGRQKLADKWQKQPYIVTSQPIPDIPIYEVKRENGHSKPKLLHRNMLLPFVGLPCPTDEEELGKPLRDRRKVAKELEREVKTTESDSSDDSSSDSTKPDDGVQLRPPKYKLPERKSKDRQKRVPQNKALRQRRGTRQRRAPDRFQAG